MENTLVHVPHSSLFIPDEYRKTALISQEELEEENRLFLDLMIHIMTVPTEAAVTQTETTAMTAEMIFST